MSFQWQSLAANELSGWDERLLDTEASYMQYPYWNESMQSWRLKASYLTWGPGEDPLAWVCVLSFGLPRFRIGMIREGPVWLHETPRILPIPSALRCCK